MKFKSLHAKAHLLDELVDEYRKTKRTRFVPMNKLKDMTLLVFSDAVLVNLGLHKLVFRLRHKSHVLALKVGRAEAIERDHRTYRLLPHRLRHAYFARIFWHTKYCVLQEYGAEAKVSPEQLAKLRKIAMTYGLLDITYDNVRVINGNLKIIDAGIAPRPGLFRLWKAADAVTHRLPKPVRRAFRKSRLLTTAQGR